jgi:sortase A
VTRRQSRAAVAARWLVGAVGELLITAGAVLLLFVAWQLWWTDVEANRSQSATVEALAEDFQRPVPSPTASPTSTTPISDLPTSVAPGQAFGILRIPRLGEEWARPVLEGIDPGTLQDGIGHYPKTALPGAVGNVGLAGHRTTYGRPFHDIEQLRPGDKLVIETARGHTVYAVDRHAIVPPTATDVIAPVPQRPGASPTEAWLTLTTCHPKYSAEQRYIVFARLVGTYPRGTELPAGTLDPPVKGEAR